MQCVKNCKFPQFSHAAEEWPVELSEHKTATSCKSTCSTLILSSLTHSHSLILDTVRLLLPPVFFCSAHLATLLPRRSHAGSPPGPPRPFKRAVFLMHPGLSPPGALWEDLAFKAWAENRYRSGTRMPVVRDCMSKKDAPEFFLDFSEVFNFGVYVLPDIFKGIFQRLH